MKEKYNIDFNDTKFKEDALKFVKEYESELKIHYMLSPLPYFGSLAIVVLLSIVLTWFCLVVLKLKDAGMLSIGIVWIADMIPLIVWWVTTEKIALRTTINWIDSTRFVEEIASTLEKMMTPICSDKCSSAYYRLVEPCKAVSIIRNNIVLKLHKAGRSIFIVYADTHNVLHEHYCNIFEFKTTLQEDNEIQFTNNGIIYLEAYKTQPSTIFEKITEIRQEFNLSEEQFAKDLGITVDNLHNIKRLPDVLERIIIGMEREYNINPDWLRNKSDTKYCELSLHEKAARAGGSILAGNDMEKKQSLLKLGGVEKVPEMDFDVQVIEALTNILKNDDEEKLISLMNL